MLKKICLVSSIFLLIFFILSTIFYAIGCDPKLQPFCLRYDIKTALIIDHEVEVDTCTKCVAWSTCTGGRGACSKRCILHEDYDCYRSYAIASIHEGGSDHTCRVQVADGVASSSHAKQLAKLEYIKGQTYDIYANNDYSCRSIHSLRKFAIVALVFNCLTTLTLIIILVLWIKTLKGARP